MMPGPPPDVTTKRWYSDCKRLTPRREQPRQLARVLVVARPLDRLARSHELGLELRVGVPHAAGAQRLQRALRALAAVHAGRSEKDHGVLDLLLLEAPQRFQVFGENADRPRFGAFEKLLIQIRERLLRHTLATLSDAMRGIRGGQSAAFAELSLRQML